jgi:hypothetical protein
MGPRYVFQLLFSEKNVNVLKTQQPQNLVVKLAQIWNSQNFIKCLTKFKNNQILLNKISHRFLMTTKLYTEGNISIILKYFRTSFNVRNFSKIVYKVESVWLKFPLIPNKQVVYFKK